MQKTTGTLYGIGVGPGDPELMPIKAVRILSQVQIVFAAASAKNASSRALEIARPHIPDNTRLEMLGFPMSREAKVKEKAWQAHARRIVQCLQEGLNAAFLTLGDPLTYSTYGYIVRRIHARWPDTPIVTVPGITSYQAAAAAINRPLAEGEESLLIISGCNGGRRLRALAGAVDNVVLLKAYRHNADICSALEEARLIEDSIAVSNCGRDDQTICRDIKRLKNLRPNYWTLIMAQRRRNA